MIENLTREYACNQIQKFALEGRLVQGKWHWEEEGHEYACLLGAIHKDIHDASDCPANVMPKWLAQLIPILFDGIRTSLTTSYGLRFVTALRHGNASTWVLRRFLARIIDLSIEYGRSALDNSERWEEAENASRNISNTILRKDIINFDYDDFRGYLKTYADLYLDRGSSEELKYIYLTSYEASKWGASSLSAATSALYLMHILDYLKKPLYVGYEKIFDILLEEMNRND